jgi:hypothetical protein
MDPGGSDLYFATNYSSFIDSCSVRKVAPVVIVVFMVALPDANRFSTRWLNGCTFSTAKHIFA